MITLRAGRFCCSALRAFRNQQVLGQVRAPAPQTRRGAGAYSAPPRPPGVSVPRATTGRPRRRRVNRPGGGGGRTRWIGLADADLLAAEGIWEHRSITRVRYFSRPARWVETYPARTAGSPGTPRRDRGRGPMTRVALTAPHPASPVIRFTPRRPASAPLGASRGPSETAASEGGRARAPPQGAGLSPSP